MPTKGKSGRCTCGIWLNAGSKQVRSSAIRLLMLRCIRPTALECILPACTATCTTILSARTSCLSVAPDGNGLAASGAGGLFVYKTAQREPVFKWKSPDDTTVNAVV